MNDRGNRDPGFDQYFRWPTAHFPIQLPGCRVTLSRGAADGAPGAIVRVRQAASVPLLLRFVDAEGYILRELYPRRAEDPSGRWEETFTLDDARVRGGLGISFTWGFYVPMMPYVPGHPLGIVMAPHAFLADQRTLIEVTAEGRPARVRPA